MNGHTPRSVVTPQLVIGLVILALGVIFLLNNLGVAQARVALRYWPAALILVGLAKILQARSLPGTVAGSAWVLLGSWLLANSAGWIDITFWRALRTYWPVILVAIGLSTVWRTLRRNQSRGELVDARNDLRTIAVLGGVKRASTAPDFKGGEITAFMGGADIDLTRATLRGQVVLDTFAMWGGIQLRVPEGWAVEGQVFPLLGGFEDKTRPVADPAAPRLVIRGVAIMGGVEVRNPRIDR